MSYKPTFDGSRMEANQPPPAKGMMESVSASGLKGKTFDSGAKPDLNEGNKYNTSQGFWPNQGKRETLGTETSVQNERIYAYEYKTNSEAKPFNEPSRTEDHPRPSYPSRYEKETKDRDTFKSRSPRKTAGMDDDQNRPSYTPSSYVPRHIDDPSKDVRSSQNQYPFTPNYRAKVDMNGLDKPPIYKAMNTEQSTTSAND